MRCVARPIGELVRMVHCDRVGISSVFIFQVDYVLLVCCGQLPVLAGHSAVILCARRVFVRSIAFAGCRRREVDKPPARCFPRSEAVVAQKRQFKVPF